MTIGKRSNVEKTLPIASSENPTQWNSDFLSNKVFYPIQKWVFVVEENLQKIPMPTLDHLMPCHTLWWWQWWWVMGNKWKYDICCTIIKVLNCFGAKPLSRQIKSHQNCSQNMTRRNNKNGFSRNPLSWQNPLYLDTSREKTTWIVSSKLLRITVHCTYMLQPMYKVS